MATNLDTGTLTERGAADEAECPVAPVRRIGNCSARHMLLALGWICVALGAIGIAIPGMSTTIFLLTAAWAFSKSSKRFHGWLYNHAVMGPPVRDWHQHRVIPAQAKTLALSMMAASLAALIYIGDGSWILPGSVALCLMPVAWFIVTRPSRHTTG